MDLTARKTELEARRAVLKDRLRLLDAELDSHDDKDWEELATLREGDEVLETMGQAGEREIRQIEAALHRLADGDYGFCVKCGAEIGQERLDAVPYTPHCRSCAA